MSLLIFLPFLLQGVLMAWDELYFHEKRGLPRWERLGHPLDTLSVLVCLGFLLTSSPNTQNLVTYVGLALFSCLFITKDEFVHAELCGGAEHWLHSALFVLHPVLLALLAWIWWENPASLFLKAQAVVIGFFMVYQITRWCLPWRKILPQ